MPDNDLELKIKEIMDTRKYHIDLMACAFIKQVGSTSALDYELVEQRSDDGTHITWYFRKRENICQKVTRTQNQQNLR